MRIGVGYDSHAFASNRKLILAGVEIPFEQGLSGHSDADVIAHAVTDALLGASGLGDIGHHFPPSDAQWQDANSIELLRHACHLLEQENYQVVNVDVSVILERPRLGPHVDAMRARLAGALDIATDHVSIKPKTNEGMGWIGQGLGIAALAVVLIDRIEG